MTRSRGLASLALASMMALASVAPAGALTDSAFNYSTPKTGYLAVSTMAFAPDGSGSASNSWFNAWSNGSLSGNGCFNTGITLPQGAKITQVRVMYAKGVDLYLIAIERETGVSSYVSQITRSLANSNRVGFTQTLDVPFDVDNNKYQLGMGICVDTGETFHGARITYTYTTAGD